MLDPNTVSTIEQVSGALVLGGFQAYNMWQHRKNRLAVQQTQKLVNLKYDDVEADLIAIRQSVENLMVKIQGGDRRAPKPAVPGSGAAQNLARRWGDSPNFQGGRQLEGGSNATH